MFPGRLPRGQQVSTIHLLFRIIPQHVAVFQPRIGSLLRERQISYRIRAASPGAGSVLGGWLRAFQQLRARFTFGETQSDSADECVVAQFGRTVFCGLRGFAS